MAITLDGTTGATVPAVSDSGNLTFTGTGNRITGDMSNATIASRVAFQTSTANSTTNVSAIPNGTGVNAVFRGYGASDPTNAPSISLAQIGTTESTIRAEANGSSSYVPMTFYTNGSEQMRISTAGIVTGTAGNLMLVQGTAVSTATTSFTGATSGASTALTASAITGTIAIGQVIAGTNITAGTTITAGSGTSWTISPASTGTVSGTITVVGVDFLNIPSWVKRITVMFNGLSLSNTDSLTVQLGTGGVPTTSGYTGTSTRIAASTISCNAYSGTGFETSVLGVAANLQTGNLVITNITGNTWTCTGIVAGTVTNLHDTTAGVIAMAGVVNLVRITSTGTATFDAGSINIMYE